MTDRRDPKQSPDEARARFESFEQIFADHVSYVSHLLRRLGVREADLDDATQETFLVVHRRLKDYDPRRPLRPWIAGIGYRVASEHRRRTTRRGERSLENDHEALPDPAPSADVHLGVEEDRRTLIAALDALPQERRAVLVMHDIDGTSMGEVAEALEIPVNTGYSRLRIARGELNEAVRRLMARRGKR